MDVIHGLKILLTCRNAVRFSSFAILVAVFNCSIPIRPALKATTNGFAVVTALGVTDQHFEEGQETAVILVFQLRAILVRVPRWNVLLSPCFLLGPSLGKVKGLDFARGPLEWQIMCQWFRNSGEYKVEYQINTGGFSLPPENLEEQCFGLGATLKLAHVRL